jgi:hypothetical protein
MRLCLPARMGGGGKAESTPWSGPAGAQRPPHGGDYSALGNERAKPLAFPPNRNGGDQAPPAATRQRQRHPCATRRQSDVLRPGLWASGRPASRGARAPAGQLKNTAPSGARSAGKSATSENPAHSQWSVRTTLAPAIVTGRPRRYMRLGEFGLLLAGQWNRARCGHTRRSQYFCIIFFGSI